MINTNLSCSNIYSSDCSSGIMISPKKLVNMARKWQREASSKSTSSTTSAAGTSFQKGHFVIYTADRIRFVIPLMYLNNRIFRELFKMSEDEFGLPRDGPITLPCDAALMTYIIKITQRGVTDEELETALLISIATKRCSFGSGDHGESIKQLLVSGY